MKLYLGSRDYCPEGFITVDIDPKNSPDIVADVVDLHRSTSTWMDNCPRGYKEPPCIASIDTHQVIEGVYSIISNKGD